jgi:EAL domain-containing protein (putative c-di-GMP-specific phosphodiesterase class I)
MIQFGRRLGLRVVAEGIEDEATLSFIRLAGAHLAQGYYLSRPLTAADATTWLAAAAGPTGSDHLPDRPPPTEHGLGQAI